MSETTLNKSECTKAWYLSKDTKGTADDLVFDLEAITDLIGNGEIEKAADKLTTAENILYSLKCRMKELNDKITSLNG